MGYSNTTFGMNQGIIRYTQGYSRQLTKSEQSRGYLFISNDQKIKKNENIDPFINGNKIEGKMDKSGRIIAGKSLLVNAINKDILFKLDGNKLYITF